MWVFWVRKLRSVFNLRRELEKDGRKCAMNDS
jgi:hypothetical protein